ncbi:hypothetical protein HHK36_014204 [Tetracentron sinense]|uniref:Uncharacterized protein n=1 Tax=Tetracentron sinense TaxID=13715 RepID=A0A834Z8D6_TETSI|nr:hypothetical protein HHK36_014204 [Tetracentron sinense]
MKNWRMKGGKDEDKISGPLFPRLHVNDTEKGGPRAPPRNKMALYEQLSIPSQRFNSGSSTPLPLPPNNASNLIPPASSNQGSGHERSVFSPFYNHSPTPTYSAEKFHSRSSDGVNLNTTTEAFERKSMKTTNYRTSDATWHLSSPAECSSFHPRDFSNSKNFSAKKLGDEDDYRVPTFVHSGITPCYSKGQQSMDRERLTPFSPTHMGRSSVTPGNSPMKNATCISSMQLQNARDKQLKLTNSADLKSRQNVRNQSEENPNESLTSRDCTEKPASHPLTREMVAEPLKHANASLNQERQSKLVDDCSRSHDTDARLHQEHRVGFLPESTACEDGVSVEPMRGVSKGNASWATSDACLRASLGDSHRNPNEDENCGDYWEDRAHRSLQVRDVDRNDDVSETSVVDYVSSLDISPDDVVGVIGQKHFWKARREIVNQQRAFALQVFELHRLIKVQRLFAGSPHLLVEDDPYLVKPSLKVSPVKKLPSEYVLKLPPQIVKLKDNSQKQNQSTECAAENAVGKPPLPSLNNGINKVLVSQRASYGPYSGNPPPAPVAADNQRGPWCFPQPPGNQWLVPVMSPSEGLVYKPYTGSYPPIAGFMPPVYGGYGPLSLPPMGGDFLNTAYGVPASHHQGIGVLPGTPPVDQSYFPPYGMPVMNPAVSGSAVEQMSPFTGTRPHEQADQLSTGGENFNMPYQSSCNMSSQKSGAISCCVRTFQTSKDSEVQGSTASSPCERAQGARTGHVAEGSNALPLFPTAPAVQVSDRPYHETHSSDQPTRAIRVVPHNPRSATESAARIFRSIQEERKQYDSS